MSAMKNDPKFNTQILQPPGNASTIPLYDFTVKFSFMM